MKVLVDGKVASNPRQRLIRLIDYDANPNSNGHLLSDSETKVQTAGAVSKPVAGHQLSHSICSGDGGPCPGSRVRRYVGQSLSICNVS